jgi:hypothetical protein
MTAQDGEGIRAVTPVQQGGTIEVDVGTSDDTVEVSGGSAQTTSSHPVTPGKRAEIPVPNVPGGTILSVTVGKGARARVILVEVIAPGP